MARTTAPLRTSGYCNPSLPRTAAYDPHQRCRGCDCTAPGCPCAPTPDPIPETPVPDTDHPDPTDDLDGPIVEAYAAVRAAADAVSRVGAQIETDLTWLQAIALLDHLRASIHTLRVSESVLERHIYLTGEHGKAVVDGIGPVIVGRSRDRKKWDERGVAQAVLDQHMTQRAGEMPNDPWDVVEWLLEVMAVGYCRVTPLRALGIDPDDFCESKPGSISITLPPRT